MPIMWELLFLTGGGERESSCGEGWRREEKALAAPAEFSPLAGISNTCCPQKCPFSTSTNCISNLYQSIAFILGPCQPWAHQAQLGPIMEIQ